MRSWFDLLYNWPTNSELLFNNSLLELTYFLIIASFLKLRRSIRAKNRKLENSKFENEMSSDKANYHCFNALSVSQWMHSWSAHLFSVCEKWNSVCIGHLFDQFIFLYKHVFVYLYSQSQVFSWWGSYVKDYTMQLLIFGVKTTGPNSHNLLLFFKNNQINAGSLND